MRIVYLVLIYSLSFLLPISGARIHTSLREHRQPQQSQDASDMGLQCHEDADLTMYLNEVLNKSSTTSARESVKGRMYACTYDYTEASYKAHSYVSFGQEAINCFDLPPLSNSTSHLWHSSGCTPFRKVSGIAASIYQCVRHARSKSDWLPEYEDIMQRMSKYAWQSLMDTTLQKLNSYLRKEVTKLRNDFGTDLTDDWWWENVEEVATSIGHCFRRASRELSPGQVRRALRCLPSLWGRVGFGVGGLRNEGLVYRKFDGKLIAESLRFNCHKEPGQECREQCLKANTPQLMACPRLAVAPLAHFTRKLYNQNMPTLRWMGNKIFQKHIGGDLSWCKVDNPHSPANCLLFTQCAHAELVSVCARVPECCAALGSKIELVATLEPEEVQTVVVKPDQSMTAEGVVQESLSSWAAGVAELATKQGLFTEFGCKDNCVDSSSF